MPFTDNRTIVASAADGHVSCFIDYVIYIIMLVPHLVSNIYIDLLFWFNLCVF